MTESKFVPPDKSPKERRESNRERQKKRQNQLEAMARLAGWESFSQFVTQLKNGKVEFPRKPNQS